MRSSTPVPSCPGSRAPVAEGRYDTLRAAVVAACPECGDEYPVEPCDVVAGMSARMVDHLGVVRFALPGVTSAEAESNAAELGRMLRQFGEEFEAATGSRPTTAITSSPEAARVATSAGFRVVDPTSPRRGRLARWWDRVLSSALGTPGRQVEDRSDYGMGR
jgi:hypothetical protein